MPNTRSPRALRLSFVIALAVLVLLPASASAQPSDDDIATARAHYNDGEERFEAKDYAGAIDAFTKANAVIEHPKNDYNIAKSYERLDDAAGCITWYERYIESYREREAANPVDILEVNASIKRCKLMMRPKIHVVTRPAGANVFIDNDQVLLGQTPYESSVGPGKHTLYLELAGHERRVIEFEAETTEANVPLKLSYDLVASSGETATHAEGGMTWKGYVGIGAIVVGAGLGVTGFLAGQEASDLYNDTDDYETLSLVEGVGYIGGGALVATGILLLVLEAGDDGSAAPTAGSSDARVMPLLGPVRGGAMVGADVRW